MFQCIHTTWHHRLNKNKAVNIFVNISKQLNIEIPEVMRTFKLCDFIFALSNLLHGVYISSRLIKQI